MKRSKIFLGITTGVLAVVAFTAAKVAKFSPIQPAYYSNGNQQCTLSAGVAVQYFTAGTNAAFSGLKKLYEINSSACAVRLYTNGSAD
jgi:hypothetical protein